MKENNKFLLIISMFFVLSASTMAEVLPLYGNDPHDSLLFDGENSINSNNSVEYRDIGCFFEVKRIKGKVRGRVLLQQLVTGCDMKVYDTVFTFVDRELKEGDTLVEGSIVDCGPDAAVFIGGYLSNDFFPESYSAIVPTFNILVNKGGKIILPNITSKCGPNADKLQQPPQEIRVLDAIVTYDQPEGKEGPSIITKGKRSSAKHTKTRYSHEVKIDGNDTLDIIRVYKGSVEVTYMKTDASDEEAVSKEMEKLSKDMEAGKLSMEELQAKMSEFQSYGQNLSELMTPINVDEGSKCIITKFKRTVEPLGPGDEDQVFEQ